VPLDYPRPGKWVKNDATPIPPGSRNVLAITDTATAATFQTRTALLCDDDGSHCVGANAASLGKAAEQFVPTSTEGALAPAKVPDYASGAYPLTVPVYAAVQAKGLAPADAGAYATLLEYISTTGQVPGTAAGQLPPGYAPLTPAMKAQTAAVVGSLRAASGLAPGQGPGAAPQTPAGSLFPAGMNGPVPAAQNPGVLHPGSNPVSALLPAAGLAPAAPAGAKPEAGKVPVPAAGAQPVKATEKTEYGFAQYSLLFALGFGLLAALASPLLGRIRNRNGAGQ
jgi:hypothetical protein